MVGTSGGRNTRWTASLMLYASVVLISGLGGLMQQATGAPPLVGGAGYAAYFDHQRADILAMRWVDPPRDGLTVEAWVRLVDWHITPALFSYAVYDSSTTPAYDQANELQLYFTPDQQQFFRATSRERCYSVENGQVLRPNCVIVKPREGWTHVATTWDRSTGDVAFYKNGELAFKSTEMVEEGDDRLTSPRAGGVLVVGQEMDGFLSDFDERQSLDAVLDEFRMWDRPLSAAEIQTNMHKVIHTATQHSNTSTDGLHLLWQFDSFEDAQSEEDMSGNGHNAMVGAMPSLKNELLYLTSRGIVKPTRPLRVASRAPVYGGTVVVFASADAPATLVLPALDQEGRPMTAEITRAPSAGSLSSPIADGGLPIATVDTGVPQSSEGVFNLTYQLSSPCEGLDVVDSFEYSVVAGGELATATVLIHCLTVESPESQRLVDSSTGKPTTHEIEEDQSTVLILGGVGRDGEPVTVNITALPDRGQLYQVEFEDEEQFYNYADVVYPGREPITGDGAARRVTSDRGIVVYVPELDNAYETSFKYVHLLASGHVSPEAEYKIRVMPMNDAPQLESTIWTSDESSLYSVGEGGEVEITLTATDIDSSFSSDMEFAVVVWPTLGKLYQEDGVTLIEERSYVPQISAWGAAIPAYSDRWGASFSSQYSHCSCCNIQKTCPHDCGCTNPSWHAEQALGEPNAYPVYGDNTAGWEPSSENSGTDEFLTVEYLDPVYVSRVSIYEVFNPGAVWRISSAATYMGNATEWSVLWEGEPDPLVPKDARIFSPPLCSDVSKKAKYIRVHLNASAVLGWHVIDAISLQGSFEYPPGRVSSKAGKLVYKPEPGVHVTGQRRDRLLVTVSDCLATSEPSKVEVALTAPEVTGSMVDNDDKSTADGTASAFAPAQVVQVAMFDTADVSVSVDVSQARQHALAALAILEPGESIGATTVDILPLPDIFSSGPSGDNVIVVRQQNGTVVSTNTTTRLTDAEHRFRLHPPETTGWTGSHNLTFRVWATTAEIVHRLDIQLQPTCPPDAGVDTCALNASDCVTLARSTFDAAQWRCVTSNNHGLYLIIGAVIALLSIIAAAENVEMDLQSPLAKVIDFLRCYQKLSNNPWLLLLRKGPSMSEAASLEQLVLKMSGRLGAIDLKGQLTAPQLKRNMSQEMIRHLIREYDNTDVSSGASYAGSSMSHRNSEDVGNASVIGLLGSSFSHGPQGDHQRLSTRRLSWAQAGDSMTELASSTTIEVRTAGSDFFLDTITDRSVMKKLPQPLAAIIKPIVQNMKLDSALAKGSIPTLMRFMMGVEEGYAADGYHCLMHAVDVTNRLAAILFHSGIATAEDTTEHKRTVLAAVIAAVVHDYKHPQVNNAYLVEEESPISLEFNDYAVLEMYSLRSSYELLTSTPLLNFTSSWSISVRKAFRKTVINVVLGTDMGGHFDLVGQFTTTVGQSPKLADLRGAEKWLAMDTKERMLTLKIAMKVADIGHCYTRLDQHQAWVGRLAEEFFKQGDSEKRKGRKPSPLMDRDLPGVADANNNVGFFTVIALPLLNAWVEVFPECQELLDQANRNLEFWKLNLRVDK